MNRLYIFTVTTVVTAHLASTSAAGLRRRSAASHLLLLFTHKQNIQIEHKKVIDVYPKVTSSFKLSRQNMKCLTFLLSAINASKSTLENIT